MVFISNQERQTVEVSRITRLGLSIDSAANKVDRESLGHKSNVWLRWVSSLSRILHNHVSCNFSDGIISLLGNLVRCVGLDFNGVHYLLQSAFTLAVAIS